MKFKELCFITNISLLPVILLLAILRLSHFIEGIIYYYIIIGMIIIYLISFILVLFFAVNEILNSNRKSRIILLILFSIFYLPIYYVKYVNSEEKALAYFLSISSLVLLGISYFVFKDTVNNFFVNKYKQNIILKDTYQYISKNKLFTINVDKSFSCTSDLGEYQISCDRNSDDSFLGIYSYEKEEFSEAELDDIKEFHINDTINVIEENDYEYEKEDINDIIKITYNNMEILLTQRNYFINNKQYSLIILKESPRYNENVNDFFKVIDTIKFLN